MLHPPVLETCQTGIECTWSHHDPQRNMLVDCKFVQERKCERAKRAKRKEKREKRKEKREKKKEKEAVSYKLFIKCIRKKFRRTRMCMMWHHSWWCTDHDRTQCIRSLVFPVMIFLVDIEACSSHHSSVLLCNIAFSHYSD